MAAMRDLVPSPRSILSYGGLMGARRRCARRDLPGRQEPEHAERLRSKRNFVGAAAWGLRAQHARPRRRRLTCARTVARCRDAASRELLADLLSEARSPGRHAGAAAAATRVRQAPNQAPRMRARRAGRHAC